MAALTSRKQVTGTRETQSEGAHYSMRLAARENLNEITRRFTAQKNWVGRLLLFPPLRDRLRLLYKSGFGSSCSSASLWRSLLKDRAVGEFCTSLWRV